MKNTYQITISVSDEIMNIQNSTEKVLYVYSLTSQELLFIIEPHTTLVQYEPYPILEEMSFCYKIKDEDN